MQMDDEDWKPEQGDEAWSPDPERQPASYTDTELRFSPLYRRVQGVLKDALPYDPTEAETLAETRRVLDGTLTDDDA